MRDDVERVRRGELQPRVSVPIPERADLSSGEEEAEFRRPETPPYLAAVGSGLLALLACVPHWVAISAAFIIACVGLPIAWGFRRITEGARQRLFIAITATLLLVLALSVASSIFWLRVGLLTIPGLPDLN